MFVINAGRLSHSTIVLLALLVTPSRGDAVRSPTAEERKLLQAVLAGKTADYTGLPEGQKTLSAEFLQRLLFSTPAAKVPGRLVHIKGAIVKYFNLNVNENKMQSGDVPFDLVFDHCAFASFVCVGAVSNEAYGSSTRILAFRRRGKVSWFGMEHRLARISKSEIT